jgi:hypothetical protein
MDDSAGQDFYSPSLRGAVLATFALVACGLGLLTLSLRRGRRAASPY